MYQITLLDLAKVEHENKIREAAKERKLHLVRKSTRKNVFIKRLLNE